MQYFQESSFITLTYSDDHLPYDGNLKKSHLQLFFKRLRGDISPRKIRYYACGEYGKKFGRPHYHVIGFGIGSADYDILNECWAQGYIYLGSVTRESCEYTAGYVMDKWSGKSDPLSSVHTVRPFQLCSQGVGRLWLDDNAEKVMYDMGIRVKGKVRSMPRYYRKRLGERLVQDDFDQRTKARMELEIESCAGHGVIGRESVAVHNRELRAQRNEEISTMRERKESKL